MSVNSRRVSPRPGMTGWTHAIAQYPLPPGLPERTRITVVSAERHDVVVRDVEAREWTLGHWQVDAGFEYLSQQHGWLPERDPRVLAHLAREVSKLRRASWEQSVDSHREECIEGMAWVLERNHHDGCQQPIGSATT